MVYHKPDSFSCIKMPQSGLSSTKLNLEALNDPGDRYQLGELLGSGVNAEVYIATDSEAG